MDQKKEIYPTPVPGIPIIAPEYIPLPGQVIVGYQMVKNKDMFMKPDPKRMNKKGFISIIALLLCCWPLACIPCFTSCSYDTCQRPVYNFVKKEN